PAAFQTSMGGRRASIVWVSTEYASTGEPFTLFGNDGNAKRASVALPPDERALSSDRTTCLDPAIRTRRPATLRRTGNTKLTKLGSFEVSGFETEVSPRNGRFRAPVD